MSSSVPAQSRKQNNHATNPTNFKLDPNGEYVGLYTAQGDSVDTISYENQQHNTSTGKFPDGGPRWFVFSEPTLGASDTFFLDCTK